MSDKYEKLIDAETWDFIQKTESWYPPETVDFTIARQREIYDAMCRAFHAGRPESVRASDGVLEMADNHLAYRVYEKQGGTDSAQVVYYHGGGYVVGGLESHDDVCAEICDQTGYRVTSIDYRLAPEHTYPADFHDALAGFEMAASGEIPVVLCGDSAGGNLAAAVAHASRKRRFRPIGQVLIYPGLSSKLDHGTYLEHANAPMLTLKDTKFYKSLRTGGNAALFEEPDFAPLNDTDFSALPPTVIITAECDPLSGDGKDYRDAIVKAGGKAVWINEEGLVHGYLRARHSVERARQSFARITHAVFELGKGKWAW